MARKELVSQEESDMMRMNESTFMKDDIINSIKQEQELSNLELPKIPKENRKRTVEEISTIELKSMAYDLLGEIENKINLKNIIDAELVKRIRA